ncbi:MAG: hypothetical protein KF690_12320 [Bacteroidetes bacterium]|nr:hypothetical protein [Bacteroidota bacterium]
MEIPFSQSGKSLMRNVQAISMQQLRTLVRWRHWLTDKTTDIAQSVWDATRRESRETQAALRVLSKMLQGQTVTDVEKKLLVEQSKDLARILPLIALQGIPVPVPITPVLIALASRYKLNILPGDQSELMAEIQALEPVPGPPEPAGKDEKTLPPSA